jgi:single-strand DNA-binding protein
MSRSVNRVTLVGNAGSDPDVRETGKGTKVAHVSLATNRSYEVDGQEQRRTDWHRLTFWGGAAEAAELYLRKGNRLYVEGRIEYGSYERDGVTIPTVDVVVQDFVFLDRRVPEPGEADRDGVADEAREAAAVGAD